MMNRWRNALEKGPKIAGTPGVTKMIHPIKVSCVESKHIFRSIPNLMCICTIHLVSSFPMWWIMKQAWNLPWLVWEKSPSWSSRLREGHSCWHWYPCGLLVIYVEQAWAVQLCVCIWYEECNHSCVEDWIGLSYGWDRRCMFSSL